MSDCRIVIAHANADTDPAANETVLRAVPTAEVRDTSGDPLAYGRLFRELWLAGKPFILIEHDVLPGPGMIEALCGCSSSWCSHGYGPSDHMPESGVPMGLCKFRPMGPCPFDTVPAWADLSGTVAAELLKRGVKVHQHFPPVLHLPALPLVTLPGPDSHVRGQMFDGLEAR